MDARAHSTGSALRACIRLAGALSVLLTAMSGRAQDDQPAAVPADRQASNVAIITINGEISDVTAASVGRRIELAERAGADAIVFEIDTPGGALGATIGDPHRALLGIAPLIKNSSVRNTVAWVRPQAYSAGAIIAFACRDIVTTDPAAMGDAIPILALPLIGMQPLSGEERQKLLAPILSDLVDSARRNGWDEMLVQGIATSGVELWWVENLQTGRRIAVTRTEYETLFGEDPPALRPRLFSGPPDTRSLGAPLTQEELDKLRPVPDAAGRTSALPPMAPDDPTRFAPAVPGLDETLVNKVSLEQTVAANRPVIDASQRGQWKLVDYVSTGDGPFVFTSSDMLHYGLASDVVRNDAELARYFGAKNMLRLDQNWSEGLVGFMNQFWVRALLIVVFLIALFLEMTHPGVALPGAVAVLALVGILAPPMLIDLANWWEVGAIVGGLALLILEIFVTPGFGVFGVVGVLALFGGLVGTFVPEGGVFPDSPEGRNDLMYGVLTLILASATAGVGIYFLSKHLGSLPLFGALVLKDEAPESEEMLAAMAPDPHAGPVQVGMRGRAITPLRPAGRVEVADRIIDAVAEMGYIPAGSAVVVTGVSTFRVTVEAAPAAAQET